MPRSSSYVCTLCGFHSPRWLGKCPQCDSWNTFVLNEMHDDSLSRNRASSRPVEVPVPLADLESEPQHRFASGMNELDRVLGGGFVPGALILLAGDPGIGKSTLLLSVADFVSRNVGPVLYTSGEESLNQVKMRARRLNISSRALFFAAEQNVDSIVELCNQINPVLLIVDSIQTCQDPGIPSLPGGPNQVRACALKIQQFSKARGLTAVLVGHTVKEGGVAGPRVLEHLVDTVLYFEGDANHLYRIVRAQKNRFGATNEIAVFEMRDSGLAEVSNPSEIFLSERHHQNPGSCVAVCLKGARPVCLEVQALVGSAAYGAPRRVTADIEYQRATLVIAVLARKMISGLDNRDAFLKIVGGIGVDEPGIDLACAIALASSYYGVPVRSELACFGEIGLSGEVRAVSKMDERMKEAFRVGFSRVMVPMRFKESFKDNPNIIGVSTIDDAVRNALSRPLPSS